MSQSFVKLFSVGIFLWFALVAILLWGWVANVLQVWHMVDLPITGMFLFKVAGILFAPLGAILGWLGIL